MIQANELRIGNLVMYSDIKKVSDVGLWLFSELDARISFINDFEPIPLTEEWLLKFGFINGELNNFQFIRMELRINGYEYDYNGIFIGKIEYVHQLQNLYFALTQTELELKQT